MSAAIHYVSFRHAVLPWTVSEDDERRFKRIVKRVVIVIALLFLLMPWIPVPKVDRTEVQELPPQFAKLLLENKPVPPPPPVVKQEKPPGTEDKQNPTKIPETAKPEPTKAPVPEARKPVPDKPPG